MTQPSIFKSAGPSGCCQRMSKDLTRRWCSQRTTTRERAVTTFGMTEAQSLGRAVKSPACQRRPRAEGARATSPRGNGVKCRSGVSLLSLHSCSWIHWTNGRPSPAYIWIAPPSLSLDLNVQRSCSYAQLPLCQGALAPCPSSS